MRIVEASVCTPKIIGIPTCLESWIDTSTDCAGVTTTKPFGRPLVSVVASYSVTAGAMGMRVTSVCCHRPGVSLKSVNSVCNTG